VLIGTYNRHVKFGLKIPNHLGKMSENLGGFYFFYSHCRLEANDLASMLHAFRLCHDTRAMYPGVGKHFGV